VSNRPWGKREKPPWWPWTRDFISHHGWKEYVHVVVIDGNRYRFSYWFRVTRCLVTGGHEWEEYTENVAPHIISGPTGGWEQCTRCDRVRNGWGVV